MDFAKNSVQEIVVLIDVRRVMLSVSFFVKQITVMRKLLIKMTLKLGSSLVMPLLVKEDAQKEILLAQLFVHVLLNVVLLLMSNALKTVYVMLNVVMIIALALVVVD